MYEVNSTSFCSLYSSMCSKLCSIFMRYLEDLLFESPRHDDENLSFDQSASQGFPWKPTRSPQQSPIDICRCNCKSMKYPPLRIDYAKTSRSDGITVEISNSGQGVYMKIPRKEARPFLSGGMLPNRYLFDNIHLHWGEDDRHGSDHFIDGEAYAMECHIVTYNSKYRDIKDALNHKDDGVVVLAFFFQVTNEHNHKLQNFLRYVIFVRDKGNNISAIDQDALLWFLEPMYINNEYLTYPGSLTTPPYTEGVVFIILPIPVGVSSYQISILRELMDNNIPSRPMLSNRREIQSLNERRVVCVKGAIQVVMREISPESR